jgi:hypothetical protein
MEELNDALFAENKSGKCDMRLFASQLGGGECSASCNCRFDIQEDLHYTQVQLNKRLNKTQSPLPLSGIKLRVE